MIKKILLILFALFLYGLPQNSFGASVFKTPFSYYAEQQDIHAVLIQFAKSQGYTAAVSPQVEGKISGRFDSVNPDDFLESIHSAFQISWYLRGKTLYFYHDSELTQHFISSQVMSTAHLYSLLQQSNVFSPQLMPVLNASNIISVRGPQSYIDTIQAAAATFEAAQTQNIVMQVFPLKYAWADDITISSMDKDITIPGIATILRAMLTGETVSASKTVQQKASVEGLNGSGLSAVGNAESDQNQNVQQTANTNLNAVNIMADPRVNAVIVNDAAYRMPYYEQVIQDLDKPVELVEIHAAIVDINTNYSRELGVTYQGKADNTAGGGWSGGGEFGSAAGDFTDLPTQGTLGAGGLSLSTIYTMGADFFLAKVQALQEDGEARMLGKPSVLTVDNIQATLENTSTYYIEIEGYQAVDLYKVEAGTVLRVTPHIIKNQDGTSSIKLAVSVQDNQNSDAGNTIQVGQNTFSPIKQTKINTQAIVGSNQSLLIGGYYYEEKSESDSGIPILKNIPVLGHLFKSTNSGTKRMERLILITPKIIRLDEIPQTPAYIETSDFSKSPTQDNYEQKIPPQSQTGSGCTRKSPEIAG